ncbi:hypothetical protein AB0I69_42125 [Streptomyces sp. NPDC050508]
MTPSVDVRQRPALKQYGGGALDAKRRMMAYAGGHGEVKDLRHS